MRRKKENSVLRMTTQTSCSIEVEQNLCNETALELVPFHKISRTPQVGVASGRIRRHKVNPLTTTSHLIPDTLNSDPVVVYPGIAALDYSLLTCQSSQDHECRLIFRLHHPRGDSKRCPLMIAATIASFQKITSVSSRTE